MDTAKKPTIDEWHKLYEMGLKFKKLNCWDWMHDNDVFGIQNPENDQIYYCSIMGNLQEFYGIMLYHETEGLDFLSKLHSDEIEFDNPDIIFLQQGMMLSFGSRVDLTSQDLKIIKDLNLKFRGKTAWPLFRDYTPGLFPWYLNASQCRFFTIALEQVIDVALRCKKNKFIFNSRKANSFLVRTPTAKASNQSLLWEDKFIVPRPYSKSFVTIAITDELRIKRIKNQKSNRIGIWEIDTFYTPTPIKDEHEERPFFPKVCMCVNGRNGSMLCLNMIHNIKEEGHKFIEEFLAMTEKLKQFPHTLLVSRQETFALFEDLANKLGINLKMVDELSFIEQARFDMYEFMSIDE